MDSGSLQAVLKLGDEEGEVGMLKARTGVLLQWLDNEFMWEGK